jgi:Uma2 family endonuclease
MTLELLDKKYTLEEFLELDLPEEDGPYELIRGVIVPKRKQQGSRPGPSNKHGQVISALTEFLRVYGREHNIGKAIPGSACIVGKDYLIPDLAFLLNERVPSDPDSPLPYPDIAVEVLSRSDKLFEVRDKVAQYLDAGTRLVWVVFYPDNMLLVYQPDTRKPTLLGFDDELDAEPVMPGFRLPVAKLFE